jgi:hypothetical protein
MWHQRPKGLRRVSFSSLVLFRQQQQLLQLLFALVGLLIILLATHELQPVSAVQNLPGRCSSNSISTTSRPFSPFRHMTAKTLSSQRTIRGVGCGANIGYSSSCSSSSSLNWWDIPKGGSTSRDDDIICDDSNRSGMNAKEGAKDEHVHGEEEENTTTTATTTTTTTTTTSVLSSIGQEESQVVDATIGSEESSHTATTMVQEAAKGLVSPSPLRISTSQMGNEIITDKISEKKRLSVRERRKKWVARRKAKRQERQSHKKHAMKLKVSTVYCMLQLVVVVVLLVVVVVVEHAVNHTNSHCLP